MQLTKQDMWILQSILEFAAPLIRAADKCVEQIEGGAADKIIFTVRENVVITVHDRWLGIRDAVDANGLQELIVKVREAGEV